MTDESVTEEGTVAAALEALVRAVPGVTALYPSGPLPGVIVGTVLSAVQVPVAAPSLISVSTTVDGGGLTTHVTALIGVTAAEPARDTAHAAREEILRHLAARGLLPAHVTVRVGMVG